MINIAILGLGKIGSGVAELIEKNDTLICRELQERLNVKYILDLRDFAGTPYESKVVHDIGIIAKDPEIDIVCEMMGGTKPAFEYSLECLRAGKNVITSNKEVVASFGNLLCDAARDNKVRYMYEASVGGGIPLIRTIKTAYAGIAIKEISGILNGTTNYILTQMIKEDKTLEEALKEAQELGYAEADPSADINTDDTCRKICILAALCFGRLVSTSMVSCSGIRCIKLSDTEIAAKFGAAIKLVASAKLFDNGKIDIRVSPCLVTRNNPIRNADGVYNAVNISASTVGDVTLVGQGAGKFPTAGAVLSDIIDVAKHIKTGQPVQELMECADEEEICDEYTTNCMYYAAVKQDKEKVLDDFSGAEILYADGEITAFVCPDISRQTFEYLLSAGGYDVLSSLRAI